MIRTLPFSSRRRLSLFRSLWRTGFGSECRCASPRAMSYLIELERRKAEKETDKDSEVERERETTHGGDFEAQGPVDLFDKWVHQHLIHALRYVPAQQHRYSIHHKTPVEGGGEREYSRTRRGLFTAEHAP